MSKINQILRDWPTRTVITTEWLNEKGVSRQLADSYKKSGWLESFGMGAYKRPDEEIRWVGALYTLQKVSGYTVHVGGKTALEKHGLSHYIIKSDRAMVILWKKPSERLPEWFKKQVWNDYLKIRSANLFIESGAQSEIVINGIEVNVSSPEQAFMEYLYDVPKHESWDEMNYISEGLVSLRPNVLQSLLKSCNSIKVKRLFLYLAEKHNHPWFKRLDVSKIELGSGKRQIVKGGKLDKKYQITVQDLEREER
ncbi:MAG: type IV toxin-antitoxin system AbiEi family antitoxin [Gracilimonas sp.]